MLLTTASRTCNRVPKIISDGESVRLLVMNTVVHIGVLNNYLYYSGVIVYYTPKPYSDYEGPYITWL